MQPAGKGNFQEGGSSSSSSKSSSTSSQPKQQQIFYEDLEFWLTGKPYVGGYSVSRSDYEVFNWVGELMQDQENLDFERILFSEKSYKNIGRWYDHMKRQIWSASGMDGNSRMEEKHSELDFFQSQAHVKEQRMLQEQNMANTKSMFWDDLDDQVEQVLEKNKNEQAKGKKQLDVHSPKSQSNTTNNWAQQQQIQISAAARIVNEHGNLENNFVNLDNAREISAFQKSKLLNETSKNWDRFYKRNTINFFKDRHYLGKEFGRHIEEQIQINENTTLLLEIGCGVGNSIIPLVNEFPELRVVGTDFSANAIQFLNEKLDMIEAKAYNQPCSKEKVNKLQSAENNNINKQEDIILEIPDIPYAKQRVKTLVFDAVKEEDVRKLNFFNGQCSVVLILFCLSAVDPNKHQMVVETVKKLLKPGGVLLFRDYGRYDWAQSRFSDWSHRPAKLSDNFYTRHDGTLSYFFTTEELAGLEQGKEGKYFSKEAGFECLQNEYQYREITNRQMGKLMRRVWIQSVFRKV